MISRILRVWFRCWRRKAVDRAYVRGYGSCADGVYREFHEFLRGQVWPEK